MAALACDRFGFRRAGEHAVAFWAGAEDYEFVFWCQRLFVASGDVFQGGVVVCCCAHVEDGVPVADDGIPCFPPVVCGVCRSDFACLFGEPCFRFCDEVLRAGVDGQWRVAFVRRVACGSDVCLAEHDASQGGQLDVSELADQLPVGFTASLAEQIVCCRFHWLVAVLAVGQSLVSLSYWWMMAAISAFGTCGTSGAISSSAYPA